VVDEHGWFAIVDRVKELIKYKGLQVAPAELEAVLLANPAIADAAVIPVPDDDAGEVPKAFIVQRAPITAERVMAFVAERVSPYKKVRVVEFVSIRNRHRRIRAIVGDQERQAAANAQ
jgi:acyl-coenzyme A synthetase/AMP-(fatty) acid ligase